jgi:hypothetical protein
MHSGQLRSDGFVMSFFIERVYPSGVAEVLGEQAQPSIVAQESGQ